ncbi:radical SAM protein [Methanolobus psychrotolerans]|uniref:radical SAM protein n=1 Tax=Methanolobus psychrotolerans TaxID=1874706 RepID=UPI000B917A4A|nr:radical SAM protein [Methanolobus psychrotolerans]
MSTIIPGEAGSFYSFLSDGCKLCQLGAKMVLFITGICPKNCFYCPVSEERRTDVTYANERKVLSERDVLDEARQMDALGTGITGGEPLLKIEKVLHYIRLLKQEFGTGHHIHMYTAIAPDIEVLKELAQAGLDEIRFHPPVKLWMKLHDTPYADSIRFAKELKIETGIEIPSIKGADKVALFAERAGCFLNLNELEFSDTNAASMKTMGYSLRDDVSNAVIGSEEYATKIARNCEKIHFCASSYKDAVQLRKRLIRIAENTARPFDEISEDGTILYGNIECTVNDAIKEINDELSRMEVPSEMMEITADGIDIAWWILEDIVEYIRSPGRKLYIIERYPLENGLIVEKIPL